MKESSCGSTSQDIALIRLSSWLGRNSEANSWHKVSQLAPCRHLSSREFKKKNSWGLTPRLLWTLVPWWSHACSNGRRTIYRRALLTPRSDCFLFLSGGAQLRNLPCYIALLHLAGMAWERRCKFNHSLQHKRLQLLMGQTKGLYTVYFHPSEREWSSLDI